MNQGPGARWEGDLVGGDRRFGIVVARFNSAITERLLAGALDGLARHGVPAGQVDIAWVPGAFEIPVAALRLAKRSRYAAIICLGAVIRGATPHFDYVCAAAAQGVARVGFETGVPAIFGVLTTDTIEQAVERSGAKAGNKGWDAALAALEMADLLAKLPPE